MTDRWSLMKMLAGTALLGVAGRARAQKTKSFTIAYLALLPGEDRNFVLNFLRRLGELGCVDGQGRDASISSGSCRQHVRAGRTS
jgi:putative ABC transport system substrate-binding protein